LLAQRKETKEKAPPRKAFFLVCQIFSESRELDRGGLKQARLPYPKNSDSLGAFQGG
jgi:hypothetical protein